MTLEEEIKQIRFRNDYQKLAVNIIYTHSWLMNIQNNLLKKYGISGAQFNILRILRGQHPSPASVNLLKDRMLDKMSDASRLVERLRIKGLVKRNICEKDRRKVEVEITEKGLNLLARIDELDSDFDSNFRNLNTDEAATMNRLLDKLRSG